MWVVGPRWLFVQTASRRQDGRGPSFYPIVCCMWPSSRTVPCDTELLGLLPFGQNDHNSPVGHFWGQLHTLFASLSLPPSTDIWTDWLFEGFQSTLLVSPRKGQEEMCKSLSKQLSETSSMPECLGPALLHQESRPVGETHLYQLLRAVIVVGAGCCRDTQEGLLTEPESGQGRFLAEGEVGLSLKG